MKCGYVVQTNEMNGIKNINLGPQQLTLDFERPAYEKNLQAPSQSFARVETQFDGIPECRRGRQLSGNR
jgi:hypothetical protein